MSNNVSEWRYRLKISQETAAELLGISLTEVINLEADSALISKSIKLALLACELAYIAADQFAKDYPSTLNNIGAKNLVEAQGRQRIRERFISEGRNSQAKPLIITILPESFIHYIN
jgi:transcriptional regulator with XRE-family HTH domain